MKFPYTDVHEIAAKLNDTIVFFAGRPVYVIGLEAGFDAVLRVSPLPRVPGIEHAVNHRWETSGWNITDFNLGYWNPEGRDSVCYMRRMPMRQWRQGLCEHQVIQEPYAIPFSRAIYMQSFVDMLQGVYPTFEEAKDRLAQKRLGSEYSLAFSRVLAIHHYKSGHWGLAYKNRPIYSGESLESLTLSEEFSHLHETLEEHGLKIA